MPVAQQMPATRHCSACSSKPRSIFRDVPPAALGELERRLQTGSYSGGTTLFLEGDEPRTVCCIGAGRVKLSRNSPDGRAVVLYVATAGDILGARSLLLNRPHDLTGETIEDTCICFVPQTDFLDFLKRHGAVSLRLAEKLSCDVDDAYRQVLRAVTRPVAERVAEALLTLCATHGKPVAEGAGQKTSICQEELAEMAGVSRRSLNRALGALREEGIIESGRCFIVLRNPAALRNALAL